MSKQYISDATVDEIMQKHCRIEYERGRWIITATLPDGMFYDNQPIHAIRLAFHKTLDGNQERYAKRIVAEKYVEVMGLQ